MVRTVGNVTVYTGNQSVAQWREEQFGEADGFAYVSGKRPPTGRQNTYIGLADERAVNARNECERKCGW